MTVRITRGTFGWFNGRYTVPLDRTSGPVNLDAGLEYRLVHVDKIAEYVNDSAPFEPDYTETEIKAEPEPVVVDYEDMCFDQLGEELRAWGLEETTIHKLRSKKSRVSKLKELSEGLADEALPSFDAVGLV